MRMRVVAGDTGNRVHVGRREAKRPELIVGRHCRLGGTEDLFAHIALRDPGDEPLRRVATSAVRGARVRPSLDRGFFER